MSLANQMSHVLKEWNAKRNAKLAAGNVCYMPEDHASWHHIRQGLVEALAMQKSGAATHTIGCFESSYWKNSPRGLYNSLGSCT